MAPTQKPVKKRTSGRPALTEEQQKAMRDKIAICASQLFKEEGYDAVSMRRIAKEINVTPMALYTYYPSKLAILSRLWIELFEEVSVRMQKAIETIETPQQRLETLSKEYISFWIERPENYHLVFMSSGLSREDVADFVEKSAAISIFSPFFEAIAQSLKIQTGALLVKEKTDLLLCALHGIMQCAITMPGYAWTHTTTLVENMVTTIIKPDSA